MSKPIRQDHVALWERLEDFQIGDPESPFPFAARLARENRWTPDFAHRVIDEYKRFLFLAVAAGHPVTPSRSVDEAWHLHLLYTRSYWDELCGTVLMRPLHHDPTKGGETEDAKFTDWYARTCESYARFFGAQPPEDIWPTSHLQRAAVSLNADRNDRPKSNRSSRRSISVAAVLVLTGLIATPALAETEYVTASVAAIFGIGILLMVVIGLVSAASRSASGRTKNNQHNGSSCGAAGCGGGSYSSSSNASNDSTSGGGHDGGGFGGGGSDGGGSSSGCSGGGCSGGGCGGGD